MPRTRRLRSSNTSEDVMASIQLDSDNEPILKSQRERRTRSSLNKNSNATTPTKINSNKRITRQTTITEFIKSVKNGESSDTSDNNSLDTSKASKSMGMKCPRPDLKPIKSLSKKENSKKVATSKRETRQSTANKIKKRQKIMSLSSGESDSEYESFNSSSSDVDDVISKEEEYHSSFSDAEEDESETDETDLILSDSADDNTNYVSSDDTQLLDENTNESDEVELKPDDSQVETGIAEESKEVKSIKKKGKIKGEVQKKILTEQEKKEKEERLKRIEETVNHVVNNPHITLSEEAMKPRPRYNKQHNQTKSVNETVQLVIDEVADKALKDVSQTSALKSIPETDPSTTTSFKKTKKCKNTSKTPKNANSSVVEIEEGKEPMEIDKTSNTTPVVSPAKVIGRRGRPPGSPNKKKKAPELQKFLQMDYSKITERPGIVEPIVDEVNPNKEELTNLCIEFRKLMKSRMIIKQSITRFVELHEILCHIAREVSHEHDSLLRLVPNNKCRANDIPKVKKRLLRAVGDKVSDKFVRKALKGDDDYVLDDVWIPTEHPDQRYQYRKVTSEFVISQFHEEVRELLAPPSIPKLVEVFKTFRLNDEASQKICDFDYPVKKYEPPQSVARKIPKKAKIHTSEVSKETDTPSLNSTDKSPRKILEPVRKSTRRKARGETPDKSMEKRVTRSQNNVVKLPAYNEVKRKRRKNIKRGIFFKDARGRLQRYLNKRRIIKKMEVIPAHFVDNYREKHFESIIHVVLNYFASNDIIVDFRQRNFWDFLLSDSTQLNSLFNNRIDYVRNKSKVKCDEEELEKMGELLKSIQDSIKGATLERNKRIQIDGILRNGLFRNDVILEYQSLYESFAAKVALKEYGWKFFNFYSPKNKNESSSKNEVVECFELTMPEKMKIKHLLLCRNLTNLEKWNKYIDFCKDRKLHEFFEDRSDLWGKNEIYNKYNEASLRGKTLECIKIDEESLSLEEKDELRKLKDLIWERDYMPTSDPVTRRLFNLKKELNELMYERNKILDHVFESSIALNVRDILEKKLEKEEEELKKKFDETKIEKEEDLDQIPLNKEFMSANKHDIEVVKNLGNLFNFMGILEENSQCGNQHNTKSGNSGGTSNGLSKKPQTKYKCIIKDNEVILKRCFKKKSSTNESTVDETPELSSDKNKIARDSHNPLKRKRELKGILDSITNPECSSTQKRQTGMLKKLESLNKEKNTYFWRTSFNIPNVDNRLTRGGLKNLENSSTVKNDIANEHQSPLSLSEDIKNTISIENEKSTMSASNSKPIWDQFQKVTNSQANNKLKNSDRENKINISGKRKKCIP
uniref:Transcriptional regulator ATRX homolog n=1 Tax=Strongyloides papillosus TaxID=174720 RepID=A0A0N5C0G7_STREA